ncbi:hypothetical protein N431DRAFT_400438 [Stipitochalara longipes BDJ]|nr:hypothetical protein N431DRAFT_400438 [Stipitochalara longipes BDJ]
MNSTNIVGALPPPPGVTPNFVNSEFNGNQIIIAGILLPVLMFPFLGARLYAKISLLKKIQNDDYMIILAVPFTLGFSIMQMLQTRNGSGYHMWDVPLPKFITYFYWGGIFGSLTYGLGTLFIKASILLFYLRLPSTRAFKIVTYLTLVVACGYCLFGAFTWLFMCRPIRAYWDLTVKGTCLNFKIAFLVGGALNVATDLVMLLLPLWVLRPLRLPLKQKVGVTVILMTGSFVCVVSTIRLAKIPSQMVDPDFTWAGSQGYVWCILEMNIGIICACLPALKTIAKHHYPGTFNDDPVFSTGDPHNPQQQSVQWLSTFATEDSEQPRSNSSVYLTTLSTNASTTMDDYSKDIISPALVATESLQMPHKVMAADNDLLKDVP